MATLGQGNGASTGGGGGTTLGGWATKVVTSRAGITRLRLSIDQEQLEHFGVEQADVYDTIRSLFSQQRIGTSHRGEERQPADIVIGLPKSDLAWNGRLAATPVAAAATASATSVSVRPCA